MGLVRVVSTLVWLVVFVVLLLLAIKNAEPVTLRFYFDLVLQAPLIVVLFAAFALGALFGMLALLGTLLRQRREISFLKKSMEPSPAAPLIPPPI